MPTKNDLSSIKVKPKDTLTKTTASDSSSQRKPGRKPKSIEEKESKTVGLKFTPSEYENLKEKAGLVPLATFIKEHLRNKTDFLD